jgi:hypothetical protein
MRHSENPCSKSATSSPKSRRTQLAFGFIRRRSYAICASAGPVAQQDRAAVSWRIGCPIRTPRAAPQRNINSRCGTAAASAHFWSPASGNVPSGGNLTVAAADLGSVWLGGATAPGTEQIGRARSTGRTGASGARSG